MVFMYQVFLNVGNSTIEKNFEIFLKMKEKCIWGNI